MKYMSFIQNARSKAEKFFRSGFAFLVLIMAVVILFSVFSNLVKTMRESETKARSCLSQFMETEMSKCANIGRKMQYAGANIKNELLPELRLYLYSLSTMSQAFYASFGETDAPVNQHFLSKVTGAVERLEQDYSCGYPAQISEKALFECLNEFERMLNRIN